jgi:hypothetical protein
MAVLQAGPDDEIAQAGGDNGNKARKKRDGACFVWDHVYSGVFCVCVLGGCWGGLYGGVCLVCVSVYLCAPSFPSLA